MPFSLQFHCLIIYFCKPSGLKNDTKTNKMVLDGELQITMSLPERCIWSRCNHDLIVHVNFISNVNNDDDEVCDFDTVLCGS